LKKIENKNGIITLALGEITGHHHSILCTDAQAELFEDKNGKRILSTKEEIELDHQEHGVVLLPAKTEFEVYIQEEYNPLSRENRKVVD
jgi:aspartokinase-like uncharacterized kinase